MSKTAKMISLRAAQRRQKKALLEQAREFERRFLDVQRGRDEFAMRTEEQLKNRESELTRLREEFSHMRMRQQHVSDVCETARAWAGVLQGII